MATKKQAKTEPKEYYEGWNACYDGVPYEANPYEHMSAEWQEWSFGYQHAYDSTEE